MDEEIRLIITSFVSCWYLGADHVLETDLTVFLSSAFSEEFFPHGLSGVWSHVSCAIDQTLILDYWIQNGLVALCECCLLYTSDAADE